MNLKSLYYNFLNKLGFYTTRDLDQLHLYFCTGWDYYKSSEKDESSLTLIADSIAAAEFNHYKSLTLKDFYLNAFGIVSKRDFDSSYERYIDIITMISKANLLLFYDANFQDLAKEMYNLRYYTSKHYIS